MSDVLAPGGGLSMQLEVTELIADRSDRTGDNLNLSHEVQLDAKHSSQWISEIHDKYGKEIQRINEAIRELPDRTSDEYYQLIYAKEELQNKEDKEVEAEERRAADYQEPIQAQITTNENIIKADSEEISNLKDTLQQIIERS